MNGDQLKAELLAATSLMRLLNEAQECKRLYEEAGLAMPEPLVRLYGETRQRHAGYPSLTIAPPKRERMPLEAKADWVSIHAKDATATTIALAVLRQEKHALRPKQLADRVTAILTGATSGSVYNLAVRLEGEGVLLRSPEGWALVRTDLAGVLDGDLLWAPVNVLAKPDLAAHRREAILHILGMDTSGLQIMQIVERLNQCSWVKAPVNKDLLKIDMQVLSMEQRVKRRANSGKWEVA